MNAAPDYSKCSLRELRDVAARIDKAKFPDRYAMVLREIERHEAVSKASIEVGAAQKKKPVIIWDNIADSIYVIAGAIIGAFLGIVWLSITSVEMSPDSIDGMPEIIIASILGLLAAEIGVKIMRKTRRIGKD